MSQPRAGESRVFRVRRRPIFNDGVVTHVISLFEDVSAERERERFLRTLDKAVQTMQIGVTVTDVEGTILYTNPADARMHGWTTDELIGQHSSVFAPSGRKRPLSSEQLQAMKSWRRESVNTTRDGRLFPVQLLSDLVTDLNDQPVGLVTTCEDITERKRAAEQIESLAYRDTLTGLPNRRLFTDRLELAVTHAQRQRQKLAVIFVDLDGFKLVNDSLGHAWGDELLRHAARRIEGCVRHGDTVARLGGDEFTLILPGIEKTTDAERIAAKVLDALRPPLKLGTHEFFVTAQRRPRRLPGPRRGRRDPAQERRRGHVPRQGGRPRHGAGVRPRDGRERPRPALGGERAPHRARSRASSSPTTSPSSARAPARCRTWRRSSAGSIPPAGLLTPGAFLPLAETSGAIVPLGRLHAVDGPVPAPRVARPWAHPPRGLRQRLGPAVPALGPGRGGLRGLAGRPPPPDRLILDVAEADCMQKPQQTLVALRELKALGVRIALDDFGVGYSSLAHLRRLPIDALKIDRSFTCDITKDEDAAAIASAVIALARTFGFEVIAEGVETQEQRTFLEAERCSSLQGDLFASSRSAADLLPFLERARP